MCNPTCAPISKDRRPRDVEVTKSRGTCNEPVALRMTRLSDGSFLLYANGEYLIFPDTEPLPVGRVGLLVEAGTSATFDNVTVHGANAFLDPNTGLEELLMDDPFYHINIGSTPYMWGLLGANPTTPTQSAWEVVDGGGSHGKVLKGTASSMGTEAFRGDQGWINQPGENNYMNYFVQADVKLMSATDQAGVCLRVRPHYVSAGDPPHDVYVGDRLYELRLDAHQAALEFRLRYYSGGWPPIVLSSWSPVPNPTQWHTLAVEAIDRTFKCYLDGDPNPKITADSPTWMDGIVGLWVQSGEAVFDNVKVLDLR